MEETLTAKTVLEKTNLDGARELDPSGVEQIPRHHGEKRKREGLVSGEGESGINSEAEEEVILVGDTKAIKKFGEQRQPFNLQSNMNLEGSLVKQESGEEPVRAKQGSAFNDFDKLREERDFAVGQTWALYDDKVDGMPRLYARITKVSAPGFCLSVTWLEPDPDDKEELQSYEKDLPVSVGWFKLGKSEDIKDRRRFFHLVHCKEGSSAGSRFSVYPREGETWAIFKGRYKHSWSYRDIDWSADPGSHRKYNYAFVEIVSEEDAHISADAPVGFLHKAKGFSSVFCRFAKEVAKSYIRSGYTEQFSHRVPSFKIYGIEAESVPRRGAYELDPAALPKNIKEIDVPSHLLKEPTVSDSEENNTHSQCVYFAGKGVTFQTGQVWSFRSGEDNFPRYYGKIQKITFVQAFEQDPVVKLHIGRLKARPIKGVIQWIDKEMPIGCGNFRARKVLEIFTDLDVFSRLISQDSSGDGDDYSIMPKAGDVWAIYRNWSNDIEVADLQSQSYDLVEVLDDKLDYKVLLLAPDGGFKSGDSTGFGSVYVAATEHWMDGADVRFTVPKCELLRFSHRVPTSKATKEMHGVLQEVYEPNI